MSIRRKHTTLKINIMTTTTKKFKATKIEQGVYEYRGFEIEKDFDLPNGYHGKWTASNGRIQAVTMKECKAMIDEKLSK